MTGSFFQIENEKDKENTDIYFSLDVAFWHCQTICLQCGNNHVITLGHASPFDRPTTGQVFCIFYRVKPSAGNSTRSLLYMLNLTERKVCDDIMTIRQDILSIPILITN